MNMWPDDDGDVMGTNRDGSGTSGSLRVSAAQKNALDLLVARWALEEFVALHRSEIADINGR